MLFNSFKKPILIYFEIFCFVFTSKERQNMVKMQFKIIKWNFYFVGIFNKY